jgi:hypothetical protein
MVDAMASNKPLYLTRSEIFAAAWRRFRAVHGAKATPRQHPNYWATCLRMMWLAAKGDAFWLVSIRDDAREQERRSQPVYRASQSSRCRSVSRNHLRLLRDFAA